MKVFVMRMFCTGFKHGFELVFLCLDWFLQWCLALIQRVLVHQQIILACLLGVCDSRTTGPVVDFEVLFVEGPLCFTLPTRVYQNQLQRCKGLAK